MVGLGGVCADVTHRMGIACTPRRFQQLDARHPCMVSEHRRLRRTQHADQCISGATPAPGLTPARPLAGDELFSDANEYKEIQDGFFLEAEGKVRMRCRLRAAGWCGGLQAHVLPCDRQPTRVALLHHWDRGLCCQWLRT